MATQQLSAGTLVPHPVFFVSYEQKNITTDITPYVLSVTYTDHLSGEADELELELEDTDGRWIDAWYPGKTDRLNLRLGYEQSPLLPCGSFEIEEVEFSSPPDTVRIRAIATSIKKALRTRASHAYENTSLAVIAQKVAKRNGLKLIGAIRDIKIDRVTQFQEHDLEFLVRMGKSYGYAFKVRDDMLVFTELETLRDSEPVTTLRKQDVLSIRITDKVKGVYTKAKVSHYNTKQKKLITYELNADGETVVKGSSGQASSGDTLKIHSRSDSKATAQSKAESSLAKSNHKQTEGSITFIGNPKLVSGNSFDLLDYGRLSGKYTINVARHTISRDAGYTTDVDVNRGGLDKARQAKATKKASSKKGKKAKKPLITYDLDSNGKVVAK